MLGSIPQQDVFQRVTSAKSVKVAIIGSMLGGTLYFCFAMLPMFIASSATLMLGMWAMPAFAAYPDHGALGIEVAFTL